MFLLYWTVRDLEVHCSYICFVVNVVSTNYLHISGVTFYCIDVKPTHHDTTVTTEPATTESGTTEPKLVTTGVSTTEPATTTQPEPSVSLATPCKDFVL